jgi:hypothetical protein
VGRDMRIDKVTNTHIHDDAEQQWQTIDLRVGNGQFWWCPTTRVAQPWRNLASQMPES